MEARMTSGYKVVFEEGLEKWTGSHRLKTGDMMKKN